MQKVAGSTPACLIGAAVKIRITQTTTVAKQLDFCCFTGTCRTEEQVLEPGTEIECSRVEPGPSPKKARPARPPRIDTVLLAGDTLHPDRFAIPAPNYEVVE